MKIKKPKAYNAIKPEGYWKTIYQLPLMYDGYNHFAKAKHDVMALHFDHALSVKKVKTIVDIINGEKEGYLYDLSFSGCEFFLGGKFLFSVRGWEHLTGKGGLNIHPSQAKQIQDEFVEYIYDKLKEK